MMEVEDLIGIPFIEFGRDRKKGLDCYGLVIEVERRLGKTLTDVLPEKFDRRKAQAVVPSLNLRKTDRIKEGTVLEFYSLDRGRLHVGVALDDRRFIHATENQGVRISTFATCRNLILANIYEVI